MSTTTQKVKMRPSHVSPKPFARLRAAMIDGRTQNVLYRRNELRKLYNSLVANSSSIQDALMRDSGTSRHEAQLEFFLSLSVIRDRYAELSPNKELKTEYSIANGHSTATRRVGYGLVYIIPSRYTLLYSVMAPLSAAIAAANCTVLEVSKLLAGILRCSNVCLLIDNPSARKRFSWSQQNPSAHLDSESRCGHLCSVR
jgi:acyl-CoA reductase-like NAD-dependent aldehyde dehydrogenase